MTWGTVTHGVALVAVAVMAAAWIAIVLFTLWAMWGADQ